MSNTVFRMAEGFLSVYGPKLTHKTVSLHYPMGLPREYRLHNNVIARMYADKMVFDWCGWYTPTTANHMNNILTVMGSSKRVSYAHARDSGDTTFTVFRGEP